MIDKTIADMYAAGYTVTSSAIDLCSVFDSTANSTLLQNIDKYVQMSYSHKMVFAYDKSSDVTNYNMARLNIARWLDTHVYMINRLTATETLEYNPIENYNNKIHESTSLTYDDNVETDDNNIQQKSGDLKTIGSNSNHTVTSNDDSNTTVYGNHIANNTTAVAPYNTDVIHLRDHVTSDSKSHTDTITSHKNGDITDTGSSANTITDNRKTIDDNFKLEIKRGQNASTLDRTQSGNIGVTTSQQMIQSERDIAMWSAVAVISHEIISQIAYTADYYI